MPAGDDHPPEDVALTWTPRGNRRASRSATVDLPAAGMPVTKIIAGGSVSAIAWTLRTDTSRCD